MKVVFLCASRKIDLEEMGKMYKAQALDFPSLLELADVMKYFILYIGNESSSIQYFPKVRRESTLSLFILVRICQLEFSRRINKQIGESSSNFFYFKMSNLKHISKSCSFEKFRTPACSFRVGVCFKYKNDFYR